MTSRARDLWLARAGLPLGLALAALAVTGWTVPAGDPPRGTSVTLTAGATGELAVAPRGELAQGRDLHPGEGVEGSFTVTNRTGSDRFVSLRATLPTYDLDARMTLVSETGGRTLAHGSLGAARRWSRSFTLPRRESRSVKVRLAVAPGARNHEFRTGDVRIELRSEASR